MNEPRNHHYVSQVLSRKFMSEEGKLFRYNKTNKRFKTMRSTRGLFSQRDLNSIIGDDGNIDDKSVEDNLNKNFETDFPKHYQAIINAVNTDSEIGEIIPNTEELDISMEYLIGMALIGPERHPERMRNQQDAIFDVLKTIAQHATKELHSEIHSSIENLSEVTNKLPVDFEELRQGMMELMGEVKYSIMIAPDNHFFILPDCSAGTQRYQMPSDFINEVEFINPSRPVGLALMPINSKVLVVAAASRILPDDFKRQGNGTFELNAERILEYNIILYKSAFKEIACENEVYLKEFIHSIDNV